MNSPDNSYDVIIAGGGPAGSSLGIRLAVEGLSVLLVEQKQFPRPKLCGEFISPECWCYFDQLGVTAPVHSAGGTRLKQTVFYARRGHSVSVPSDWLQRSSSALGLSRAEMDEILLLRAKECGVTVLEGATANALIQDGAEVRGISVKHNERVKQFVAALTIDATGRSRSLVRRVGGSNAYKAVRPAHVAFKVHLRNAQVAADACEIYFYRGGYGGLNGIENGLSNLCFIVSADDARSNDSDPLKLMNKVLVENRRAAFTLERTEVAGPWLAVSLESFGEKNPVPATGLLTVGDAAAFIDPFTGSGILMALECSELAAATIIGHRKQLHERVTLHRVAKAYSDSHKRAFKSRLRVSALLRRAAFVPRLADMAILMSSNQQLRQLLTQATRSSWWMGSMRHPSA